MSAIHDCVLLLMLLNHVFESYLTGVYSSKLKTTRSCIFLDVNGSRSRLSNAATYQKCGVLGSGIITIPQKTVSSFRPEDGGVCLS